MTAIEIYVICEVVGIGKIFPFYTLLSFSVSFMYTRLNFQMKLLAADRLTT